ncbi:MAG: hypothetical protein OXE17_00055 [Chloroflexi bacterium]|nr:hypothetical protein [Chloroflexota bacterium]
MIQDLQANLLNHLELLAQAGNTIYYREAAQFVGMSHRSRGFFELLDNINRHEHNECRPLITALVVHNPNGGVREMPGEGFFSLALGLGLQEEGEDDHAFWVAELERVFQYWGQQAH